MHRPGSLLDHQDGSQSEQDMLGSLGSSQSDDAEVLEEMMLRLSHQISQMDRQLARLDMSSSRAGLQPLVVMDCHGVSPIMTDTEGEKEMLRHELKKSKIELMLVKKNRDEYKKQLVRAAKSIKQYQSDIAARDRQIMSLQHRLTSCVARQTEFEQLVRSHIQRVSDNDLDRSEYENKSMEQEQKMLQALERYLPA
ncbi:hypothetical protein GUITHDRAFT_110732 [Guillardia theta CCMP2712]|uniref:Uncharacterized protein n=1 Tax=Guillardia theta (strain CCMP2712) TaxID=905079 RepID=L1J4T7_GUITC|nr:hypothetical protein GUITHDRAFT_110732 [Guillardia theta CCMP2712]EKX43317.1 hypothetical protein GUITHDRAFT_110732 [Guillardia theta CCMP2712]|eukprot:XP_005830297.1 hypothetical protein GUITHDRAFT_110732 [Guillardia theta CCMP2712]